MKEGVPAMNLYLDTVTKLCEGIESPNPKTKEFIERVATGWADLASYHCLKLTPDADSRDALQAMANLLDNTDSVEDDIERFLGDPIAFGSFKECYPWTSQYVVKFCAERNPTLDEQSVLMSAAANSVDHFFVPSLYIQLPRPVDSQLLDKNDDDQEVYDVASSRWVENPEWQDDSRLTHICIQPRVEPLGDSDENARQFSVQQKDWGRMVEAIPQLEGEYPSDWTVLCGTCLNWLIDFAHYYGKAGLIRLRDFCETFGIWDLHAENVGALIPSISGRGAPVVLDWMSR